jgi:hypothetical protein
MVKPLTDHEQENKNSLIDHETDAIIPKTPHAIHSRNKPSSIEIEKSCLCNGGFEDSTSN